MDRSYKRCTKPACKKQDFIAELTQFNGEIIEIQLDSVNDASGNLLDNDGADGIEFILILILLLMVAKSLPFLLNHHLLFIIVRVSIWTSQHAGPYTLNDQLFPFYDLSVQDGEIILVIMIRLFL